MRFKIVDDIQNIFEQGKTWITLELKYAKLSLAEKLTMLLTIFVIGFVCLLLSVVVLILLGFALVEWFMTFMNPALAFLSVAGIFCVLLGLLWICRRPVLLNPLAKMLTRILIGSDDDNIKN